MAIRQNISSFDLERCFSHFGGCDRGWYGGAMEVNGTVDPPEIGAERLPSYPLSSVGELRAPYPSSWSQEGIYRNGYGTITTLWLQC